MCPGLYCGKSMNANGSFSDCGACPRGFRADENRECAPCTDDPSSYDLLFLGFMFMLPLILHCYFINYCCDNIKQQLTLFGSALAELVVSAVLSVLLMDPIGSFRLHTCGVKHFSDWYTLFYNPSPNYQSKLYCTQEAVYPLQTIVLVFYFICLVQMFIIRSFVGSVAGVHKRLTAYSALYFFPLLMFLHSMTCGLIYYGFPYLSIVISMISNAWHQSVTTDLSIRSILKACVSDTRNMLIIGGHWFLLAFGIISLKHSYASLALVPLPLLFYIFTIPFTDPTEFIECEERAC